MTLSFAFFTFLNAWWVSLFIILPFGVERDDKAAPGDYQAAPKPIKWKKKLLATTLLAALITAALALIINSGMIPAREG